MDGHVLGVGSNSVARARRYRFQPTESTRPSPDLERTHGGSGHAAGNSPNRAVDLLDVIHAGLGAGPDEAEAHTDSTRLWHLPRWDLGIRGRQGRIRFPKSGGMTLQTNSIERAVHAARFFAPHLGPRAVATRCRAVNR